MPTSKLRKNRKQPKSTITRMNRNRKRRSRKLVTKTHKIKLGGGIFSSFYTYDRLLAELEKISTLPDIQKQLKGYVQQNIDRFKDITIEERDNAKAQLKEYLAYIEPIVKSDSEDTQLLKELSDLKSKLQLPKDQELFKMYDNTYKELLKNKNVNVVLKPEERDYIRNMNKKLKDLTSSFGYR
jgi:hypothetical protein